MEIKLEGFKSDLDKLFRHSIDHLIPARRGASSLTEDEVRRLIGLSSILSISDNPEDLSLAYEVVSRIVESDLPHKKAIALAADIVLSRIGNFPGRALLRKRYQELDGSSPALSLSLERLAREVENTTDEGFILTDFQYKFYASLESQKSLSISAPTSAGKSFILNLDLIRRLDAGVEKNIVYVVPTRALISEVSARVRSAIRSRGIAGAVVRTAPFPIKESRKVASVIYVLTPERFLSLLKPENNKRPITSIFVDEAHEIQKGSRGVTLQSAVDLALTLHPKTSILFASPLISNPGYFLSLFGRQDEGVFFTETISPVSQNLLLISEVPGRSKLINASLVAANQNIDLGNAPIGFSFRGSKVKQRANLANEITFSGESTIVFANGPGEAESVAGELLKIGREFTVSDEVKDFIQFIKAEIHPDYPLVETLERGIAFHYGDMPSIVRAGVEDLFKSGEVRFLCCTSTLLQGVNLPAKHIVIENPHSGNSPMSRSDFLNLSGRAGRLLHEFHGNIWCVRPSDWKEESYVGDNLQEIKASMERLMDDGGSLIFDLIKGNVSIEDKDLAEAGFSRLYQETVTLGDGQVLSRYETKENLEVLVDNLSHIKNLKITLPDEILKSHSSLRPDHLQKLYECLCSMVHTEVLSLISPFQQGGYHRMVSAINLISEVFEWAENPKFRKWVGFLAHQWITGESISTLIRERVNYKEKGGGNISISLVIRELLKVIESEIRFKMVKYFSAYEDIIRYCLVTKGFSDDDAKQAQYHTFLEFGACSAVELSLMSLGFSRFTALKLKNAVDWSGAVEIEDYLKVLNETEVSRLKMPRVCLKEIKDILGWQ
ncbi:Helicase conserved C-terminal domain-containing protein [Pseudomonas linyingensis]|uniref:Helicase conserved C-terminal domain-containing protein n=1 Tax=Pseudomonas linyingensis TaxID=915471 RepID=A0A1H7BND7_9PSED|nr:DEAD/DEAH box helicase [Pseudomonas linyingensis]SEJ79061.1 Helicase conserved C-terminal domain-containing protein [Pseudomonas linyingensis]